MDIADVMSKMTQSFSARRAFGEAYEKDGLLVIPVALVAGGGGGGEGDSAPPGAPAPSSSGTTAPTTATAPDGEAKAVAGRPPQGSGGGLGGVVMPVGAYVVKGDQVRWVPAVDVTRLLVASLAVLRLLIRRRARRRPA